MTLNLKDRKKDALKSMLNFNSPPTKTLNYEKLWKILVCDKCGLEVISTLFTQKELREFGVTISLNILVEREVIPDVPAIYFLLPTNDNVSRICKDIENGLYENYYINFISPINREKLEQLAYSAYQSDCVNQVSKVFDQYTNYICLEDDLFVLHDDKVNLTSYSSINGAGRTEKEIDSIMNTIVDGLFSVCVTIGAVPIIRCPEGNAAELVARKLDKKIRDNLRDSRNSFFTGLNVGSGSMSQNNFSFDRPLLVILDRGMDLATPMHHSWTYQAMVHDVLDLKLNAISVPVKSKKTQYELWSENDEIWKDERHKSLPEIADDIQQNLEIIKSKEKEMNQLKSNLGLNDLGNGTASSNSLDYNLNENTSKLNETVSSLNSFLTKKRLLEVHTNIITHIFDQIKERKLDVYFELEEKLLARQPLQEKTLLDMLSSPDGTPKDKLRLLLIALLYGVGSPSNSTKEITDDELSQLCSLIEQKSDTMVSDLSVIETVKFVKSHRQQSQFGPSNKQSTQQSRNAGLFTNFISRSHGYFMEGVRNLIVRKHKLPATKIVDHLMEQKADTETDNFKYFDPKLFRYNEGDNIPRHKSPFQDAIVFVIGGGSYIEYQNLIEYKNEKNKKITYGCTELLNPEQFLLELAALGKK